MRALLGVTTRLDGEEPADGHPSASDFAWEMARPGDPDVAPLGHRLLRAVFERIQWRNQLDAAKRAGPPGDGAANVRTGKGKGGGIRMVSHAQLWRVEEVAAYLRVPVDTLYRWRKVKYGPQAARVGRYLRYDPEDVYAWVESRKVA